YPELLVAGDYGTSRYYINNGDGTFTNHTMASGTGLDGNGMGQAVADLNGDGLFDWYVTSIFTNFSPSSLIPGTGNMLYMNQGNHTFIQTSQMAGVNDGGWGWGTAAVDFDHDGLVDLVETNGYATANGAGIYEWIDEQSYFFRNNGNGTFSEIALASGLIHTLLGRGLVAFDYDNDGDQDIVIFANSGPLKMFRNDTPHPGHNWLRVLIGTGIAPGVAPNGYGTRVTTTVGETRQYRFIDSGCNYLSQSEPSAHFGLGSATSVDELRIDWANGAVSVLQNVAANQTLTISSLPCTAPTAAGTPVPADAATGVLDGAGLSWSTAPGASYAVYFGTSTSPRWVANVATAYWSPGPLLPDTHYYWRIDTVGCATTAGAIWSFTTAPSAGGGGPPAGNSLTVQITSPTRAGAFTTDAPSIRLCGMAADANGVTEVRWSTDHGTMGSCTTDDGWNTWCSPDIPLIIGQCQLSVTASNAAGENASASIVVTYEGAGVTPAPGEPGAVMPPPLTVTILSPTRETSFATTNDSISLAGSASTDVTRVTWANDRGGSGEAVGTTAWYVAAIPLQTGPNLLIVTARDFSGATASAMLLVALDSEVASMLTPTPDQSPALAAAADSEDQPIMTDQSTNDQAPPRHLPARRSACGTFGFVNLALLLILCGRLKMSC
ncbi:MAG TPA: CRTAC1 family protein, partial [Phycisphaerae bacterium]